MLSCGKVWCLTLHSLVVFEGRSREERDFFTQDIILARVTVVLLYILCTGVPTEMSTYDTEDKIPSIRTDLRRCVVRKEVALLVLFC